MGYDAVQGVATYGARCLAGATRQFAWWRRQYQAGSLGCYNPASVASGGPSLHAEGRAFDIALDANDPAQRARGDAIFARVMAHPEEFGAQEMLYRGYVWSWRNRELGRRGPGHQQAEHMNHVHLGLDVNAAQNWTELWVKVPATPIRGVPPDVYVIVDTSAKHRNAVIGARVLKLGDGVGKPFAVADRAKPFASNHVPFVVVSPAEYDALVA